MSRSPITLVPDAATPTPSDVYETEFGGEASVPAGNYGPPIISPFEDLAQRHLEVRDLERRFRDRLLPTLPGRALRTGLAARALARAYRAVAMRNRSTVVDEFGRDPARAAAAARLFGLLYRRYFRVVSRGFENIPATGPAVLVANRGGVLPLDVMMLMEAVRREANRSLRPLVEDTVHDVPVLGVALSRVGAVRACRENADRLLERGELIAVFPEGAQGAGKPFAERYQLRRFGRGGFVKVARESRAPIIPVAIVGAEEALPTALTSATLGRLVGLPTWPALGLVPLPSRWRIHVGEPISVDQLDDEHEAIAAVGATIRGQVKRLLDEALRARGSAFFGS